MIADKNVCYLLNRRQTSMYSWYFESPPRGKLDS